MTRSSRGCARCWSKGASRPGAKLNERDAERAAARVAHAAARGDQAARGRRAGRPAAQSRRGRRQADRGRRAQHVRGAGRARRHVRRARRQAHHRRGAAASCARCTTRCWPASRARTCRATTGSTRRSTADQRRGEEPGADDAPTSRSTRACSRCASAPTRTRRSGSAAIKEHERDARGADARDAGGDARDPRAAPEHKRDTVLGCMRAGEHLPAVAARPDAPSIRSAALMPPGTALRRTTSRRARAPPARPRPRARCCSTRRRAAAMRPTRRSTRSCRSACSCRAPSATSRPRSTIARELKVPVLPRGAGTSQCGQTTGAALVIDNSQASARASSTSTPRPHGDGRAGPRARPSQRAR